MLADPAHPSWGEPYPDWVTSFRPSQRDAVEQVVDAFQSVDRVVLSAPTGSGKTLLGEMVRRALNTKATYVCTDKGLQDQVLRDFTYARVLKGRSNYPTLNFPERHAPPERLSCDDCTASTNDPADECKWCSTKPLCPYKVAKAAAKSADLSVLNTAYLLAEANVSDRATFTDLDLVVADEADRLEPAIMSYVSVSVGQRRLQEWNLAALSSGADPETATAWIKDGAVPSIDAAIKRWLGSDPKAEKVRTQRELRGLRRLKGELEAVAAQLPLGNWVTCESRGTVEFKPVRINEHAQSVLWKHSSRWLLMSATVIGPEQSMEDLGVSDPWSWSLVEMPSLFPVANRPVYLCSVASITRKNPEAHAQLAEALPAIFDRHKNDRVLVHTVSFRLQQDLEHLLPRSDRYVWYRGEGDRAEALRRHAEQPGAILFAPGMDRGVDMPDDLCRAVVVCKVPYPDLSDAQVAARLANGGQDWYRRQTLAALVQMCGRGVRHERDTCDTYVLDSQAERIVREARGLLPRWWSEALVKGMPE